MGVRDKDFDRLRRTCSLDIIPPMGAVGALTPRPPLPILGEGEKSGFDSGESFCSGGRDCRLIYAAGCS